MRNVIAIICCLTLWLLAGCGGSMPPEEVEVIRNVERVREVEVTRLVEVTRTVPVTRLVTVVPGEAGDQSAGESDRIRLRILAINDFHGNIATTSSAFDGVGRVDFLASNLAAAAEGAEHSVFVSAGDLIGASPLISALFHDEPTIEAMNLLGLEINSVGNHEFDEGKQELLRMQNGGPHPVDGDVDGDSFAGADFQFLAANVVDNTTGETIFPPYAIREYQGVKVAFIGLTLKGTPSIVTREGVAGLTFQDEADVVNALVHNCKGKVSKPSWFSSTRAGSPTEGRTIAGRG